MAENGAREADAMWRRIDENTASVRHLENQHSSMERLVERQQSDLEKFDSHVSAMQSSMDQLYGAVKTLRIIGLIIAAIIGLAEIAEKLGGL